MESDKRQFFRVLLADDHADGRESLAILLESEGHTVRMAADGCEALTIAEQFCPDVVILDIRMPRMNGIEACRFLRQKPWRRPGAIYALTGSTGDLDADAHLFDAVIAKPADPGYLLSLVRSGQGGRGDPATAAEVVS